jgi:allantoin racemase
MRILVINPNTSDEMTRDIHEEAIRYARPGTEVETVSSTWGPRSIEGHYDDVVAAVAMLEVVQERSGDFDGIVIACFGDSVVTVLPRVKPRIEDTVRLHGLGARCASVRATPLTVLDCERDPAAAEREIVRAGKLAIAEDGAEAICLGCAGMGPLDKAVEEVLGVPVLDGVACGVKLLEGLFDYGLATSRVAAFRPPEGKEHLPRPEPTASR